MNQDLPEALRLASELEACPGISYRSHAAELRRQHAEIERLAAQLAALRAQEPECAINRKLFSNMDEAIAAADKWLANPPVNQCGETCERAKLCAVCARGIEAPATEVTDEQILALMVDGNNCRENDESDHLQFARAILALRDGGKT